MFNTKSKTDMQQTTNAGNGTTLISAGTTLKGDISSNGDLRIDGTIIGNIQSSAKIIVGSNGVVEGDISGNQADIVGKVSGNIRAKELLQLRGESVVTGNLYAGKLQVEPSATFNGQCHMGANIVEMNKDEQQTATR
ncbi:MAG: polymer-forming cytoskeletal protein [Sphingobacteriales bacterium]|nr:polymer-forming cytoskeletal protein [Sphingobacteriales bacterium]